MCLEKQKYFIVVIYNPPRPFMEVGRGNGGIFHLLSTNTTSVLRPQNSRGRWKALETGKEGSSAQGRAGVGRVRGS